ncbi:LysR family transcriptional regulator [Aestuariicella hydrocarbonica]|uniref:LysR family transcriptional regulator n=1 Tax=Pseudomaricurvus hydrocarbonicus TaxID=1470433 RepID=A0A9E5JTB3_9GAMM|nr:LysR substrate-binding domain-containing protein [Aestuariicella hydrocarbonica]NHO65188.1 LysR family transcriptional regulator [Aestuariicella hydrocarbonica]
MVTKTHHQSFDHRRLPLNTLRAFEAVGRHGYVRVAAEELHLSHAALSRQIRNLEDRLQVNLFERVGNRLKLTAAGRRFLGVVQQALHTLQLGVEDLDHESLEGELVLGATATMSINWLPELLRRFTERYPEVTLRLKTLEPYTREVSMEIDLAFCLGEPEPEGRELQYLYQEHYQPFCSPALLRPEAPVQEPSDLVNYPLLHERYQHWEHWFARHGLKGLASGRNIHFDYGFQSIDAARRGLGVVLADQLEVAADLRSGSLVRLLDQAIPLDTGIYLIAAREQSVRVKLFREELYRYLSELGVAVNESGE